MQKGKDHTNWKGGREKKNGYWYILFPEHPFCDSRGYIAEHRLIMEQKIDRYLESCEVIHHKNSIRDDNRIENLQLFDSHGNHISFENKGRSYLLDDMSSRICSICTSDKTWLRKSENNRPKWYGSVENPICGKCYQRKKLGYRID